MEEVVAGAVVGATIKVVLQNLLSFHVEKIGHVLNFNKDLQKLKQSIVTIRDFLEEAEMIQVKNQKVVNRWLMKLEAVAFDAHYVFDELNYQLIGKKVETQRKLMKQVRSFFSPSNPIAFNLRMARKIKDINEELKTINAEASGLGLQMRFACAYAGGVGMEVPAYPETDSFSTDGILVGRENDVTKIVEMLNNIPTEHVVSVILIVGMGGLGKTTLARKVYNDHNIISHFENRTWVYVSENFVPETVFKSAMGSLTGENVDGSREVVLRKLKERLGDKRFLLVLDNVWNEDIDKWEDFITSLEGISSTKRNVIMVTTRKRNVASIVKTHDVHELGVLSEEDCWFIIKAKAFGRAVGILSEFETIGKNIARRCGGLPLAAKVVGSLLRYKSKDEWLSIEKNWLSDVEGDGNTISKILKLSFDNLSSPSLKKCFAYCSIIPKGWWIEKDELIDLWMAEGFLQTYQEQNMEIVGNNVFNLLVQSSLLQVWQRDDYGNVVRCIMHDLVHDLALSVLNPKFMDDIYQARYISRTFADESSPIPEEHVKCLRALFFSGKVSHIMFSNFKCLHVLILNDEDIDELPVEIGKLISLRYLDISHTRMECLPNSIGSLYHLQTLRATVECGGGSCLRKLPNTLKYLINLRHLYIPNIKLPPKIGRLISLRTLPYFQVGDEEGCEIMELGRLKNLKGEIEICNLQKIHDKEEAKTADLFHKPNIFKLKLVWNESKEGATDHEIVLEGLEPHPNLKSLEINGFKGKNFPLWTLRMAVREEVRLDNLIEIKLSSCRECVKIPMLGHLPCLKSLYLHHLSNLKSLGSSFYGIEENGVHNQSASVFPALERLELVNMPNLTAWEEVDLPAAGSSSVFHRLEYLKMSSCGLLMTAPSHFPCLKELEICHMESGQPVASICGSKLISLTKLRIEQVDGLVSLPKELFCNNRDLLEVEIKSCSNLTHLIPCSGGGGVSSSLRKLEIWRCPNLRSIGCPSGEGLTSLRQLGIYECSGLTNLPIEMIESCAPSLEALWLPGSRSLTNLPQVMRLLHKMPRLTVLGIEGVPKFTHGIPEEIGPLPSLQWLGIGGCSDCWDHVSFNTGLDRFFPTLMRSLRSLRLYGMDHWDSLPDQLQHLTALAWLSLRDFGVEALPEWFGNLSSLHSLYLFNCRKLRRFPSKKAMQGLAKLTHLHITECPLLKQNLEQEVSSDDSERFKISHVQSIMVDLHTFSAQAQ